MAQSSLPDIAVGVWWLYHFSHRSHSPFFSWALPLGSIWSLKSQGESLPIFSDGGKHVWMSNLAAFEPRTDSGVKRKKPAKKRTARQGLTEGEIGVWADDQKPLILTRWGSG